VRFHAPFSHLATQRLTLGSFEANFNFVNADEASATEAIPSPEGSTRDQFMQWLSALPTKQSPVWLGLPFHAERVLLGTRAQQLTVNMLNLQVNIISVVSFLVLHAAGVRLSGYHRLEPQC
jgi:hypothetical protein